MKGEGGGGGRGGWEWFLGWQPEDGKVTVSFFPLAGFWPLDREVLDHANVSPYKHILS